MARACAVVFRALPYAVLSAHAPPALWFKAGAGYSHAQSVFSDAKVASNNHPLWRAAGRPRHQNNPPWRPLLRCQSTFVTLRQRS
jgi:hypothetical protein